MQHALPPRILLHVLILSRFQTDSFSLLSRAGTKKTLLILSTFCTRARLPRIRLFLAYCSLSLLLSLCYVSVLRKVLRVASHLGQLVALDDVLGVECLAVAVLLEELRREQRLVQGDLLLRFLRTLNTY